jgi:hypothetical protein
MVDKNEFKCNYSANLKIEIMKPKKRHRRGLARLASAPQVKKELTESESSAQYIISLVNNFESDLRTTFYKTEKICFAISISLHNFRLDPTEIAALNEVIARLKQNPNEFTDQDKRTIILIFESYTNNSNTTDLNARNEIRQMTSQSASSTIDFAKLDNTKDLYIQKLKDHKRYYQNIIDGYLNDGALTSDEHKELTRMVDLFFKFLEGMESLMLYIPFDEFGEFEEMEESAAKDNFCSFSFDYLEAILAGLVITHQYDSIKRNIEITFNISAKKEDLIDSNEEINEDARSIAHIVENRDYVFAFFCLFHEEVDTTSPMYNLPITFEDVNLENITRDNIVHLLEQNRIPKEDIQRLADEIIVRLYEQNPDLKVFRITEITTIIDFHNRYTTAVITTTLNAIKN